MCSHHCATMNSKYENARLDDCVCASSDEFIPTLKFFSSSLFVHVVMHNKSEREEEKYESKMRRIFDATAWRGVATHAREMIEIN